MEAQTRTSVAADVEGFFCDPRADLCLSSHSEARGCFFALTKRTSDSSLLTIIPTFQFLALDLIVLIV